MQCNYKLKIRKLLFSSKEKNSFQNSKMCKIKNLRIFIFSCRSAHKFHILTYHDKIEILSFLNETISSPLFHSFKENSDCFVCYKNLIYQNVNIEQYFWL